MSFIHNFSCSSAEEHQEEQIDYDRTVNTSAFADAEAEVLHWWTSGGEAKNRELAIEEVIDIRSDDWRGKEFTTACGQWEYHSVVYGEQLNPAKASILLMEVFVSKGCVGLILDRRDCLDITKEIHLSEGKNQITLKLPKSHLSDLFIRNINANGSSSYQINDIQLKDNLTIELSGDIQEQVNEMLRLKDSDYTKKIASEYRCDYRQIEKNQCSQKYKS